MISLRFLRALYSLGLEFWLALPLLGFAFWFTTSALTDHVLSRPYGTTTQLEADTQLEVHLSVTVVTIQAEINQQQGFTKVEVLTKDSVLKKLDFIFPVTDFNQLETTIASELGLSRENVRRLVRYQVKT
ncbi:hypothetical protein [Chroogloeocystis siderophila]|uniref:Uncharacterized protein n=1 Tax=Chroogloeocystis siderophila 5.2 s.c.1 TaxID=247279 RepID=A0A1U7HZA2_9CHRO|nr:hypothetical protein [Chroogloeocystis siderophila]OKH28952.1 hypothetical protein NIES1031_02015 [Chroogloeocystis siderophila 5.2 s.c.1]